MCAYLDCVLNIVIKVPEGTDILHRASYDGQIEVVRLLLGKGTDPNVQGATFAVSRLHD
jgi:ankyrin repeat protein